MTILSLHDQTQQYQACIIEVNNKPAYDHEVTAQGHSVEYLETGKVEKVKFSLETFKPLSSRLGSVNINGSVVRIARCPVRRMNVGLNRNNMTVEALDVPYPNGSYESLEEVGGLRCKALFSTITNRYPTFSEAIKKAKKTQGACAWDRQFCVDMHGNVHYKTMRVGQVALAATSTKQIIFNKEFDYLVAIVGEK